MKQISQYKNLNVYMKDEVLQKGGKYLNTRNKENSNNQPLVSVITVCRNSEKSIQKTIDSVCNQSYPNIEYIIIDGLSSDRTVDIIKENEVNIDFWFSESDNSATDAINKGFKILSGEYVFLLNADDFVNNDFIQIAIDTFNEESAFVYGDMLLGKFGQNYNILQKGDEKYHEKIAYTMPKINQPTIIFKKECIDIAGYYNTNKKIAPDYDWLVRVFAKGLRGKYNNNIITYFSLDGNSDVHYYEGIQEVRDSSFKHAGSLFWTNFYYYARYVKRYITQLFHK